jgi:DNA-binding SARP family transcriptional activator
MGTGPASGIGVLPTAIDRSCRLNLHVYLLGGFQLSEQSRSIALTHGEQRVVALLSLRSRPIGRTSVAGTLWPDTTDQHAGASLRSALWRLGRRSPTLVLATRSHLSLSPHVTVDVRDIEVVSGRVLSLVGAPEVADLRNLWSWEELLPDWSDDWVAADRERIRQLQVHTLEAVGVRLIGHGKFLEAVQCALRAVETEPFRDSAHSLLIQAYLAEGNKWAAQRHFEQYRDFLSRELGAEPSFDMTALMKAAIPAVAGVDQGQVYGG